MNNQPTAKYKHVPNDIEKNTLSFQGSRERFNLFGLKKISREKNILEKFDKEITRDKKIKLSSPLEGREEVLTLAARPKKKDSPEKFNKSSVDNKSYFHNQETFSITSKQKNDENQI